MTNKTINLPESVVRYENAGTGAEFVTVDIDGPVIADGTELVDRAHVTRLQAEVERLKANAQTAGVVGAPNFHNLKRQIKALQAELTKSRELLAESLTRINVNQNHSFCLALSDFLSNQSAPADKGSEP